MDLVPRIREPTPQKKKKAVSILESQFDDNDWEGKCLFYKAKYEEMERENLELKEALESV